MKKKVGFKLRSICGEQVLWPKAKRTSISARLSAWTKTSAYLWEAVEGKEFTADTLAKLLTEQYDVQYNVAFNDCLELIVKWEEAGIIEP